ncbi:MAG: dienelactone hydrolase family protein [Phycisphaerales bacterium]|nr:MAG: dienelactone hydrolase family protein [Phycisphaerales bacterium]
MIRICAYIPASLVWVFLCLVTVTPLDAQEAGDRDPREICREFNRALHAKDWQKAIEAGLQCERLVPDNSTTQYNLACAYSLGDQKASAAQWLKKAADNGFRNLKLFETDSDLDHVRGHPGYAEALGVVRKNLDRRRALLRSRSASHRPLIYKPPGYDRREPAPMIIALHGYGAFARGIGEQWRNVAGEIGALVVAPQGLEPIASGGGLHWGDVDDADYVIELAKDFVRKRYKIDEDRVVLTGFSQGGFIALALGARHPDQFIGVIPMAGPYIPQLDAPKEATGDRLPRFYFMVGEQDQLVDQCRQAARDFAEAGYEVQLNVYPGVAHAFPRDRDRALRTALRYVMAGR